MGFRVYFSFFVKKFKCCMIVMELDFNKCMGKFYDCKLKEKVIGRLNNKGNYNYIMRYYILFFYLIIDVINYSFKYNNGKIKKY